MGTATAPIFWQAKYAVAEASPVNRYSANRSNGLKPRSLKVCRLGHRVPVRAVRDPMIGAAYAPLPRLHDLGGQIMAVYQQARARIPQYMRQLARGKAEVHGHGHRADFLAGEIRRGRGFARKQIQRYPVERPHAHVAEGMRRAVDALVPLVVRPAPAAKNQRFRLRITLDRPAHYTSEERRVGQESVSKCRSWLSPYHQQNNTTS